MGLGAKLACIWALAGRERGSPFCAVWVGSINRVRQIADVKAKSNFTARAWLAALFWVLVAMRVIIISCVGVCYGGAPRRAKGQKRAILGHLHLVLARG